MSKIIGALLLVALAVRLVVLFFFKRNIVLNEISLVLFIAVFVVAGSSHHNRCGCRHRSAGRGSAFPARR